MLEEVVKKYGTKSFEAITSADKEFPLSWFKKIGINPDNGATLVKDNCAEILKNLSSG